MESLTIPAAAAICRGFVKAKTQHISANVYFAKLLLSIDPASIPAWETEINAAEAVRLQKPDAMDYMKAKPVGPLEHAGAWAEGTDSIEIENGDISRWFELAIQVEEIQ